MLTALYLYRKHDADLIGLLEEVGKKTFGIILKDSLRVLTRPGYMPIVFVPKSKPLYSDTERYQLSISIQSQKDNDIEELLSHVRERQINSFVKTALRFYLGAVPTLSSMLDTELIKTTPVYTPSGVIVFSNNINTANTRTKTRDNSEKKNTISKANKVIRKNVEISSIEPQEDTTRTRIVASSITISDLAMTSMPMDISSINESNYNYTHQDADTTDEDDEDEILSLLEGLL